MTMKFVNYMGFYQSLKPYKSSINNSIFVSNLLNKKHGFRAKFDKMNLKVNLRSILLRVPSKNNMKRNTIATVLLDVTTTPKNNTEFAKCLCLYNVDTNSIQTS